MWTSYTVTNELAHGNKRADAPLLCFQRLQSRYVPHMTIINEFAHPTDEGDPYEVTDEQ